mmetsp:Transcript_24967/g.65071  ORF Transcript_24967/g.65071 Transcript_24967/m.65071 type:complete len:224 (-) Transcript_24967:2175-2846(-)
MTSVNRFMILFFSFSWAVSSSTLLEVVPCGDSNNASIVCAVVAAAAAPSPSPTPGFSIPETERIRGLWRSLIAAWLSGTASEPVSAERELLFDSPPCTPSPTASVAPPSNKLGWLSPAPLDLLSEPLRCLSLSRDECPTDVVRDGAMTLLALLVDENRAAWLAIRWFHKHVALLIAWFWSYTSPSRATATGKSTSAAPPFSESFANAAAIARSVCSSPFAIAS